MPAVNKKLPSLSTRERAVIVHLAEGLTYEEIGRALSIGYETVKMHIDNIRKKLQLRRRTQIAVWWTRNMCRA